MLNQKLFYPIIRKGNILNKRLKKAIRLQFNRYLLKI